MIPEARVKDVARAIEQAHYPTSKNVTGQAFMGEARTHIAAFNACEAIANDKSEAPKEFAFADEAMVWAAPAKDAPVEAAKGVLTFSGQPTDGDGFSIGGTRYEFHAPPRAVLSPSDIVIGADLPATVKATLLAINGSPATWPGDPLVTAIPSAPDAITLAAKDPSEPLLPIETVTWSKMLSPEEKARVEREKVAAAKVDAEAAKAKAAKPVLADGPGAAPRPLMSPQVDPATPPKPFVPPANVAPDPTPPNTFAPSSPPPAPPAPPA